MTALERLARRICWLEFEKPLLNNEDHIYWRGLPQETKDRFIEEARRFLWTDGRLAENISSVTIVDKARLEYAIERQERT